MEIQKIKRIVDRSIFDYKQFGKKLDAIINIIANLLNNKKKDKDLKLINKNIDKIKKFKEFTINLTPEALGTNTLGFLIKETQNILKLMPILVKVIKNNNLQNIDSIIIPLPNLIILIMRDLKNLAGITKDHLNKLNEYTKEISNQQNNNINENIEYLILNEKISDFFSDLFGGAPYGDPQKVIEYEVYRKKRDVVDNAFQYASDNMRNTQDVEGSVRMFNDLVKSQGIEGASRGGSSIASGFAGDSAVLGFAGEAARAAGNTTDNILGIITGDISKFDKSVSDFSDCFNNLWDRFVQMTNNGAGADRASVMEFLTSKELAAAIGGLGVIYIAWKIFQWGKDKVVNWWNGLWKKKKKYSYYDDD